MEEKEEKEEKGIILKISGQIDSDFANDHLDYDQYALVYSKTLSPFLLSNGIIDKYVKITTKGKTVYRIIQARNGIPAGEIRVGYITKKALGLDKEDVVDATVAPASFIAYYLHNSNSHIKVSAWIALIGFVLAVLSTFISILSLFIEFPIWHIC